MDQLQALFTEEKEDPSDADRRVDIIIDSTFLVLFALSFAAVIGISTRNFLKFPNMVNQANIAIVIVVGLCLLSKYSHKWCC